MTTRNKRAIISRAVFGFALVVVLILPLTRDGRLTWVRSLLARGDSADVLGKPEYARQHHVDWSAQALAADRIEIEVWKSVPQLRNGETKVLVLDTSEEKARLAEWLKPRGLPRHIQWYTGGPGCDMRFIQGDQVVGQCWENSIDFGYEHEGQKWVMPIRHPTLEYFLDQAFASEDGLHSN